MNIRTIVLAIGVAAALASCQSTKKVDNAANATAIAEASQKGTQMTDVAFSVAKNYFVKNNATKLRNPKIETAEVFNSLFGIAATMGKEGKPTAIDFTRQMVIAVVLPETDRETALEPVSLQKNGQGEMTLTYKMVVGPPQSYTIIPSLIVIADKSEKGNVTLKAIQ